jgi:hypothetical protein
MPLKASKLSSPCVVVAHRSPPPEPNSAHCGGILLADPQLGRKKLGSGQVLIKLNVIRYFVNSIQDQDPADTQRYL